MKESVWADAVAKATKYADDYGREGVERDEIIQLLTVVDLVRKAAGEDAVEAFIEMNVQLKHAIRSEEWQKGWHRGYSAGSQIGAVA